MMNPDPKKEETTTAANSLGVGSRGGKSPQTTVGAMDPPLTFPIAEALPASLAGIVPHGNLGSG